MIKLPIEKSEVSKGEPELTVILLVIPVGGFDLKHFQLMPTFSKTILSTKFCPLRFSAATFALKKLY